MDKALIVGLVVLYGLGMWVMARASGRSSKMADYHVAGRQVGGVIGALSIASTWVWAPALFVSSTQAFTNGWVGLSWFLIPNALALLLMLPFALRLRAKYPNGFTLSGLMRQRYGRAVQGLYIGGFLGLAILSVSVNLLAGGVVLSMLTDLPLIVTSSGMLALVLGYTYRYGIRASLATDVFQILLIIAVLGILAPITWTVTGWDVMSAGLTGINQITGVIGGGGAGVAVSFGIISAIGLAAGPVGDQAFWQRAFAMRRNEVVKAFSLSALFFALVPLLMGVLGFAAAGRGFIPEDPGYVNLELMQDMFPLWVTVLLMLTVVSAMFSVSNSHLLSQATLMGDLTGSIPLQRLVMLGGALLALTVANLPGNSVTNMFLIYSTLRSATLLVTVATLLDVRWNPRGVALGISLGWAVGMPLSVYGNLMSGEWEHRLFAILATTLVPPVVAMLWTSARPAEKDSDPGHLTPAMRVSVTE